MRRARLLQVVLGCSMLLHVALVHAAEVVFTIPDEALRYDLRRACEKLRCEGTTEQEQVQWLYEHYLHPALDKAISLVSGWGSQRLDSVDVKRITVTMDDQVVLEATP